jgi:hypothetical protein
LRRDIPRRINREFISSLVIVAPLGEQNIPTSN